VVRPYHNSWALPFDVSPGGMLGTTRVVVNCWGNKYLSICDYRKTYVSDICPVWWAKDEFIDTGGWL
jgi:hypothetical protein